MIFSPGWKKKDLKKALQWIEKREMNDPELMKAAQETDRDQIAKAAVRKIDQEAMLNTLVRNIGRPDGGCVSEIQALAISRIRDPELLRELLRDGFYSMDDYFGFSGAYQHLTDRETMLAVMKDPDFFRKKDNPKAIEHYQCTAYSRLDDYLDEEQMIQLMRLYLPETDVWRAIGRFVYQGRMSYEDIVEDNAFSRDIRIRAAAETTDAALHARMALDGSLSVDERLMFVSKIKDQDVLKTILETEKDDRVIEMARKGITDPVFRKSVCEGTDKSNFLHEWIVTDEKRTGHFDHQSRYFRDITTWYKCRYCGLEKEISISLQSHSPNDYFSYDD